jgi:hypothetical protein
VKKIIRALSFAVLTLAATAVAQASPIIDFTGGSENLNNANETYGYSFTVSGASVLIGGLGVWDSFALPLQTSHAVGLWNSGGTLLASTTVGPAGTIIASTDALGQWREADIISVLLTPGQYYAGVYYNIQSENVLLSGAPNSIAGITYNSAQFAFTGSLAFPGSTFGTSLVGPALFTTVAAPEPITLSLFGAGLAGAIAMRRRKKRSA